MISNYLIKFKFDIKDIQYIINKMDTNKIEFCNKIAFNIKNNRFKSDILKKINELFKIQIISNNSKHYNHKMDINNLKKYPHFVSLITTGNKYLLYLTKINNENYCILIDRKLTDNHKYPKMLVLNFRFSDSIFNETIFDCELIRTQNKDWALLIESLLVYKNKIVKTNLIDTLTKIYSILDTEYKFDITIQSCKLFVKRYFVYTELNYVMKKFIPNANYNIIGLMFHTLSSFRNNISVYFNDNHIPSQQNINLEFIKNINSLNSANIQEQQLLDKIKEEQDIIESRNNDDKEYDTLDQLLDMAINDIDAKNKLFTFKCIKDTLPNIYILYDIKKGKEHKNSIARIDTLECSEFMKELFKNSTSRIVDCKYSSKFKKWIPEKLSDNKISDYYQIKKYKKTFIQNY